MNDIYSRLCNCCGAPAYDYKLMQLSKENAELKTIIASLEMQLQKDDLKKKRPAYLYDYRTQSARLLAQLNEEERDEYLREPCEHIHDHIASHFPVCEACYNERADEYVRQLNVYGNGAAIKN